VDAKFLLVAEAVEEEVEVTLVLVDAMDVPKQFVKVIQVVNGSTKKVACAPLLRAIINCGWV
jgi:hypothetical protein